MTTTEVVDMRVNVREMWLRTYETEWGHRDHLVDNRVLWEQGYLGVPELLTLCGLKVGDEDDLGHVNQPEWPTCKTCLLVESSLRLDKRRPYWEDE